MNKTENIPQPVSCLSCGAKEFKLLASGKYVCKYCGAQQVFHSSMRRYVDIEEYNRRVNEFEGKKPTKKAGFFLIAGVATLLIALAGLVMLRTPSQAEQPTQIDMPSLKADPLSSFKSEVELQKQRCLPFLAQLQGILPAKAMNVKVKKILNKTDVAIKDIGYLVGVAGAHSQSEPTLKIIDELNGCINRITVAKRRYNKAKNSGH